MDAIEILRDLTHYEQLPTKAIRAGDADRVAMLPAFLEAIETFVAQPSEERQKPNALFFIFHMLGSWREKSAYRPLAKLLRFTGTDVRHAIGEGVTETCHRVMIGVFDDDPQPLYDIILDPEADDFVRSRMCEAVAILALRGDLDRGDAAGFLARCFDELKPTLDCFVWAGWHDAIAMLGLAELRPQVVQAFRRGWISPTWTDISYFESDLAKSLQHPDGSPWLSEPEFLPFGDTEAEFSTWYGFGGKEARDQRSRKQGQGGTPRDTASIRSLDAAAQRSVVNPLRNVGRNDPCPCGSGKKHKKCCLR